jgi:hypothetical protein
MLLWAEITQSKGFVAMAAKSDIPSEPDDFPVPLGVFLNTLVGTHDEIWIKAMQIAHGDKKRTMAEFAALLATLRSTPV